MMRKYHAGFGREGACFLPNLLGMAAHSYLSLHPKVIVRSDDSDEKMAVMVMEVVGGGALDFRDGRAYRIGPSGFWRSPMVGR